MSHTDLDLNEIDPDKFEEEVIALLKLQGWSVLPENLVGHKKADAYAEKADSFGQVQRIVIECKANANSLHKTEVSRIFADYFPLVDNNLIDFILLVTSSKLAPSAITYVKETKYLRNLSYLDLLNSIINFDAYVRGLYADFSRDQLSDYYIPQGSNQSDGSLENWLLNWIDSDNYQPVAILGGYGIGKSTLARRLAFLLAEKYINNPTLRIPILISLSDISTEQDLVSMSE